jgi:hypothetical protein
VGLPDDGLGVSVTQKNEGDLCQIGNRSASARDVLRA